MQNQYNDDIGEEGDDSSDDEDGDYENPGDVAVAMTQETTFVNLPLVATNNGATSPTPLTQLRQQSSFSLTDVTSQSPYFNKIRDRSRKGTQEILGTLI